MPFAKTLVPVLAALCWSLPAAAADGGDAAHHPSFASPSKEATATAAAEPGGRRITVPVANPSGTAIGRVLALGVPDIVWLEAEKTGEAGARPLASLPKGAPFAARPLAERLLAIPFTLEPGERADLVLRYRTHADTPLTPEVLTPDEFRRRIAAGNLVDGVIFGLLAALILSALLQYAVTRWTALLAYAGMAFLMAAFLAQFEGYSFAWLWPDHGGLNRWVPIALAVGQQVAHVLFTMALFPMGRVPWLRHVYRGYLALVLAGFGLYLAAGWTVPGQAAMLAYGPLSLAAGLVFLRRGVAVAPWFLAGATVYAVFNNLLFGLAVFGHLGAISPFVFPRIGSVAEPLLFAVALAHQTLILRRRVEDGLRLRLAEARQLAAAEAEKSRALLEAQRTQMRIATTGHDLAQPLASIRFALTALRQRRGGEEAVTRHIDQVLDHTESLLRNLVEDTRRGHGDRGRRVELDALMAAVCARHAAAAAARGLRLRRCPTSRSVTGSEVVLTRILENLVGNAIRYGGSGGVLVGVRHRDEGYELLVIDTGPGFDVKRREELLAPFRQGDAASPGRVGHGLGLHIVRTLCEQSGYRLTIRSTPGRGSAFGVLLPFATVPADG